MPWGTWDSISGESADRTINDQNQITSVKPGSTTQTLTYDNNGNTLTDGFGHTYTYDAWNHVITATDGTTSETFVYDGLGRKASTASGGTTTDHYYSSQWQLLEDQVSGKTKAYVLA